MMKTSKTLQQLVSLYAIALLLLVPQSVAAATLLIGDKISIEADEVIEDDYYVSVGSLGTTVMSGTIDGDMYAFSGSVTTNGAIKGDFGALSGLSYMHASVTDDVRIVAAEVVIDDYVGGDVFVIAGNLKILSTAEIVGDVIFYGFEGEVQGEVGGSIYGTMDTLRVDSIVGGDVNVKAARELTLGSKAEIEGDVRYESRNDLVRAQDSTIVGEIQKQAVQAPADANDWQNFVVPMFISLFAALTLYLLFKKEMQNVVFGILDSPLPAGLVGLTALVAGPFISVLLISTILGMLLGIFGIGLLLVLISVGFALALVLTGALLSRLLVNKAKVSLLWILLGGLVFHGLLQVPVVGLLVGFALIAMTMGGMLLGVYRSLS